MRTLNASTKRIFERYVTICGVSSWIGEATGTWSTIVPNERAKALRATPRRAMNYRDVPMGLDGTSSDPLFLLPQAAAVGVSVDCPMLYSNFAFLSVQPAGSAV